MRTPIVVVCPGRGVYTKTELGYLQKYGGAANPFVASIDEERERLGQVPVSVLDTAPKFQTEVHFRGDNAAALIYTCALLDFAAIDRERYEIVAVLGNSMGWYLTLAAAGALNPAEAFAVVNTMGAMPADVLRGGQILYPVVDDDWRPSIVQRRIVEDAVQQAERESGGPIYTSINFGGYIVLAAEEQGLQSLMRCLPPQKNKYPLRLPQHAAFHTKLLAEASRRGMQQLASSWFHSPHIPMIDGRGSIWQPYTTDPAALWRYTLEHQVLETYEFSRSLAVALKEFAPQRLVALGPGGTLPGVLGQILVENQWRGIDSREAFMRQQEQDPFVLSMGVEADRARLVPA